MGISGWVDVISGTEMSECLTVVFPQALKYAEIQGRTAWTGPGDFEFFRDIIEYMTTV